MNERTKQTTVGRMNDWTNEQRKALGRRERKKEWTREMEREKEWMDERKKEQMKGRTS